MYEPLDPRVRATEKMFVLITYFSAGDGGGAGHGMREQRSSLGLSRYLHPPAAAPPPPFLFPPAAPVWPRKFSRALPGGAELPFSPRAPCPLLALHLVRPHSSPPPPLPFPARLPTRPSPPYPRHQPYAAYRLQMVATAFDCRGSLHAAGLAGHGARGAYECACSVSAGGVLRLL
jgi:hypothetical protein